MSIPSGPRYQPGQWPPTYRPVWPTSPVVGNVYGTPVVATPQRGKAFLVLGVIGFVAGGLLLLAALIGPQIPISQGHSIAQVHGLCNSALGQFAQAADNSVSKGCTEVGWLVDCAWAVGIAGALIIGAGVASLWHHRSR